ncbi:TIGR02270 family protein [Corallococcus llansteffanensis]|nr:TIGR02270 family protein [Corallococcus llansteffanensis]
MDVVETHLDEATWLWGQWQRALLAPDFDLADTMEMEERLLAHVDGLVEGGPVVGTALLAPALESAETARISAAFLALLNTAPSADQVRALLRGAEPLARGSMQRALEVYEGRGLAEVLRPLLRTDDAELQALVLETLVFRDEGLEDDLLADFLRHEDARVRMAALRGLREPGQPRVRHLLLQGLLSAHAGIRMAAIEVALTAGLREAWDACRQALKTQGPEGRQALVLWALGSDEEESGLLVEGLKHPARRADALWALGFSGRLAAAEACLEWLGDKTVGRLAAESFSGITGLRVEGSYVIPPEQLQEEPIPLHEEDLDADLSSRPEDDLPVPDAAATASWWRGAQGNFAQGTRYLMGYPYQGGALLTALMHGPMRRRHVWAWELTVRSRGACRVPTHAFSRRQHAALERVKTMAPRLSMASFLRLPTAG